MTLIQPPSFSATLASIVANPVIGSNIKVYLSRRTAWELATIDITGADAGTLTVNSAIAAALSAEPRNLSIAVKSIDGILTTSSPNHISVTATGTDADSAALTGTGAIVVPTWTGRTVQNYSYGHAADLVPATTNKLFKTLASMTIDCAADCANRRLVVLAVPQYSQYELVACQGRVSFTPKTRPAIPIPCGDDGSAFVVPGRSKPGECSIQAKFFGNFQGLQSFSGQTVSLLIEVDKQGTITERWLLNDFVVAPTVELGEGDDIGSTTAQGFFSLIAAYPALDP